MSTAALEALQIQFAAGALGPGGADNATLPAIVKRLDVLEDGSIEDWWPGYSDRPETVLLCADLSVAWSSRENRIRIEALEGHAAYDFVEDYWNGVNEPGLYILDAAGRVLVTPPKAAGSTAAAEAGTVNMGAGLYGGVYCPTRITPAGDWVEHLEWWGQSLAPDGAGAFAPEAFTTAAGENALDYPHLYAPTEGPFPDALAWTDYEPARERIRGQGGETGKVRFLSRIHRIRKAATGKSGTYSVLVNADPGQSVTNLTRGTVVGERAKINWQKTCDWWDRNFGKKVRHGGVVVVQGHKDTGALSPSTWALNHMRHAEQYNDVINRISPQGCTIPFFLRQYDPGPADPFAPSIAQAGLDLCVRNPGLFVFIGPSYPLNFGDGTHHYGLDAAWNGEESGMRVALHVAGRSLPMVVLEEVWRTGETTLRGRIEIPPGTVFARDDAGRIIKTEGLPGFDGFILKQDGPSPSPTITGITIVQDGAPTAIVNGQSVNREAGMVLLDFALSGPLVPGYRARIAVAMVGNTGLGGDGFRATARPILGPGGALDSLELLDPGGHVPTELYTRPPYVMIDGAGAGAKFVANIVNGQVSPVFTKISGGAGYNEDTSVRLLRDGAGRFAGPRCPYRAVTGEYSDLSWTGLENPQGLNRRPLDFYLGRSVTPVQF